MRIVFFNHYHNGDIFASKGYVSDLIDEFPGHDIIYQHLNSSKLLNDLNISFKSLERPLGSINDRIPMLVENDSIFINTWIGNYLSYGDGINWKTYYKMFERIYYLLGDVLDSFPSLESINYYIPKINFNYFDVPEVKIPEGSILISNGPVMSGQSCLNNMDEVVDQIISSTERPVILTHFIPTKRDNVYYTNNINPSINNDLNEISWIAERCDYIIGRNSGPFCFTHTQNILYNDKKNIYAIGNKKEDCFPHGMNVDANYNFIDDSSGSIDLNSIIKDINA